MLPNVDVPPLDEVGPLLWREFHLEVVDEFTLDKWEEKIPKYCDCNKNYLVFKQANPPRWNDLEAWKCEIHNLVNAELKKPLVELQDALACWYGKAPCRKPRLVITVATGQDYKRLLQLTSPLMKAYAARCQADFLQLTNQTHEMWQHEKFRVHQFVDQYEQILFLDCDCLVTNTCPDLFKLYPTGLALHDDRPHLLEESWAQTEYNQVMASQGLQNQPLEHVWNTGVVLSDRKSGSAWQPPGAVLPQSHCSEQWLITYQAKLLGVAGLPREFNCQWWFKDFDEKSKHAHIVHFANCPTREYAIQQRLANEPERFAIRG